jgi:hypothetical protein
MRSHHQFGNGQILSRPIQGLIASALGINTFVSSYIYSIYGKEWIIYYVISITISTISGLNADYRADWGLISLNKGDWFLRDKKLFQNKIYYIFMAIDILLSILWTVSILSYYNEEINKIFIYWVFIFSYAEFARRGIWIFFRM